MRTDTYVNRLNKQAKFKLLNSFAFNERNDIYEMNHIFINGGEVVILLFSCNHPN